jgi:hypothetical protein
MRAKLSSIRRSGVTTVTVLALGVSLCAFTQQQAQGRPAPTPTPHAIAIPGTQAQRWAEAQGLLGPTRSRQVAPRSRSASAAPASVVSLSHTIGFDEFPLGTIINDPTLYHLEGAAIGTGNSQCTTTTSGTTCIGQAYTASSGLYPGNGAFLIAQPINTGVSQWDNSELLDANFVPPNGPGNPLTLATIIAGVQNVSFDILPLPGSQSVTAVWIDAQYLLSAGAAGNFLQVTYPTISLNTIHVTSPPGGDWIAADAYEKGITAPTFGYDNLAWSGYAHPTASEQGLGLNLSEFRTGCSSGDPVNCASGVFTREATDVVIPGRALPLDLTRSYNSQAAATTGSFGFGWTNSYNMSLAHNTTAGTYTVTQENGSNV